MQDLANKVVAYLNHPRSIVIGLGLSLLLYLPSLWIGLLGDDFYHYAAINGDELVKKSDKPSVFGLFSFVDDDEQRRAQLFTNALIPWWTEKDFGFNFFRPIVELTHWFDYTVLKDFTALMHLHSLVWITLCSLVILAVYRRLFQGSAVALLAFLVFVLDSTHALTVIWLSNRGAIIACILGLLALLCHIRRQEDQWQPGRWLAPLAFVAALLAGEIGLSVFFYVVAYIFIIERTRLTTKITTAVPYGIIVVGYLILYKLSGFGASGNTDRYLDPFSEPFAFMVAALSRVPIVLTSQFGIVPANMSAAIARDSSLWLGFVVAYLALFVFVFLPLYKKDRLSVFFLTGCSLSTLPIIAGAPADRNMMLVSVGGCGLIASCLHYWWSNRPTFKGFKGRLLSIVAWLLVFFHLVLSPLMIAVFSYALIKTSNQMSTVPKTLPNDMELEGKDIAFVHVPFAAAALFNPIRNWLGLSIPRNCWWLSEIGRPVHITVLDEHRVNIKMDEGFVVGLSERQFRLPKKVPFYLGEKIVLQGVSIEVTKVSDEGQPEEIEATFERALHNDGLVFLSFADDQYQLIDLPGGGVTITLEDSR